MGIHVAAPGWRNHSLEDCKTTRGHGVQKGEEGSQGMIEDMGQKMYNCCLETPVRHTRTHERRIILAL